MKKIILILLSCSLSALDASAMGKKKADPIPQPPHTECLVPGETTPRKNGLIDCEAINKNFDGSYSIGRPKVFYSGKWYPIGIQRIEHFHKCLPGDTSEKCIKCKNEDQTCGYYEYEFPNWNERIVSICKLYGFTQGVGMQIEYSSSFLVVDGNLNVISVYDSPSDFPPAGVYSTECRYTLELSCPVKLALLHSSRLSHLSHFNLISVSCSFLQLPMEAMIRALSHFEGQGDSA